MKEVVATRIVEAYEAIENDLLNFLRIVPYEDQNKNTWSPKLVRILLDAGSLIDSIFRNASPVRVERTTGKSVKRKDLTMTDFRRIFKQRFGLSDLISLVYISPPILLQPFNRWEHKSPAWWSDYNNIKHNRLKNTSLATINTTLNAVCGLFELIAQYPEMCRVLLRYGWLKTGNYNLDLIIPVLSLEDRLDEMPKQAVHDTFLIQTKLFVTTIGPNPFPNDIKKILPMYYVFPRKLRIFLGKGY